MDLSKLKQELKNIVAREDVKYVIGYEKGSYGWRISPCFAKTDSDVENFIFSPLCINNLVTYLVLEEKLPLPRDKKQENKKIGVVVKGCDSRAAVQLLQEKAVSRDDIILIGIPCAGVIDAQKMKNVFGKVRSCVEIKEVGEKYIITADNKTKEVLKKDLVFESCKTCEYQNPVICDIMIGEQIQNENKENYASVKELEQKPVKERLKIWKHYFDRCIRCYACRNACPICNCIECMAEKLNPIWIRRAVNVCENTAFHILKAFHTAGRCVSCGSCERACPVNIPLTKLYKKVEKDVLELFDYRAGINPEQKPLLSSYRINDLNENII